jgi:conjugal transfer/entry exclusion protein
MAKRGRPLGFKLSEESKAKISKSKTGQLHDEETKEKISDSVRAYFQTPEGIAQREKTSVCYTNFWASAQGKVIAKLISRGLKKHYKNWQH